MRRDLEVDRRGSLPFRHSLREASYLSLCVQFLSFVLSIIHKEGYDISGSENDQRFYDELIGSLINPTHLF